MIQDNKTDDDAEECFKQTILRLRTDNQTAVADAIKHLQQLSSEEQADQTDQVTPEETTPVETNDTPAAEQAE